MRETKHILVYLLAICITLVLLFAGNAGAEVLYNDDFTDALTWTTSDNSVYIKDNDFLYIGTDGGYGDWAEKTLSIDLSSDYNIVVEQRMKLESNGRNYLVPIVKMFVDDTKHLDITYLPGNQYGWNFGGWTQNQEHAPPGENYWVVAKAIIKPSGGVLYIKPDDSVKGWFSNDFVKVLSKEWSYAKISKIRLFQTWDSVSYYDYIKITKEMNIPLDTNPPSILISSPSNGQTFDTDTLTISGTASDDRELSKIEVKVDYGSWQSASGTTSWSKSIILNSSLNTIYARATDTSGNVNETSMIVGYYQHPPTSNPTTTTTPPTPEPTATSKDSDGDGWSDEKEISIGTNPYSVDSDSDGINDPHDPNPNVPEKTMPGFGAILAMIGIMMVFGFRRKMN